MIQTIEDDLNVSRSCVTFRLRRVGPETDDALGHGRGSTAAVCEDGLTSYFVEGLHVLVVHPLEDLRILAAHGRTDGDVGIEIVVLIVELVLRTNVLLGIDAFDAIRPVTGGFAA